MSWLDIPTALFALGLLCILASAVTWVVLAQDRSQAAACWCAGGLLFGAGVVLASFASKIPAMLGILGSNVLFCMSCALRIQSLRKELGRPTPFRGLLLLVALAALFTVVTHWGLGWYGLRALVNTTLVAAAMAYIAHLALRLSQQEKSRNAFLLACIYLALACSLLVRMIEIVANPGGDPIPLARPSTTVLVAVMGLVAAVAGHFCYLGMLLDRAGRREQLLVAENARQDANSLLQQQLRRVERQRSIDQMSVSLAHELSQPVSAVLTNAQTALRALERQKMTAQELSPLLLQIEQSARHASTVIERIRSFIRPSHLQHQAVDLREVCSSASELAAADLRSRSIKLLRPRPTRSVMVYGDVLELTQALLNGLRNAADALEQSQSRTIRLTCDSEGTWAWLRVEDSGPGLTVEQLHNAFEPFYTSKVGGLGLGISIAESIAERHGGRLTLANVANATPGSLASLGSLGSLGGAIFELRLPLLVPLPLTEP